MPFWSGNMYQVQGPFQIPVNVITHGLAFNHHFSTNVPHPPFTPDTHPRTRTMVLNRSELLTELSEQTGSKDLLLKAEEHRMLLPLFTDPAQYDIMLDQTANTLDKFEDQLSSVAAESEECESWVLGSEFTVVDIALGVVLNRLALLGMQDRFWANGTRPHLERFLGQIQRRNSFAKAVMDVGPVRAPPKVGIDSAVQASDAGGARPALESPLEIPFDEAEHERQVSEFEAFIEAEKDKTEVVLGDEAPGDEKDRIQETTTKPSAESIEVWDDIEQTMKVRKFRVNSG